MTFCVPSKYRLKAKIVPTLVARVEGVVDFADETFNRLRNPFIHHLLTDIKLNHVAKVKLLRSGGMPIYEPGLEELVKRNVEAERLFFTSSTAEGVEKSDVIFIAVPTPPQPDGSVDLSFMESVSREVAQSMAVRVSAALSFLNAV